MRDWMRAHPEDRDLYASTKRALAAQEWKYVQNYADAKTTVIEEIMAIGEIIEIVSGFQGRADGGMHTDTDAIAPRSLRCKSLRPFTARR